MGLKNNYNYELINFQLINNCIIKSQIIILLILQFRLDSLLEKT